MNHNQTISSMMMPQEPVSSSSSNHSMKKHQWNYNYADMGSDSLLGMAASLFDVQQRALPRSIFNSTLMSYQDPHSQQAPNVNVITSQVLAELADDLFDAPTEDIFDEDFIEPVPLSDSNRFALLEHTLDQVLNLENGFLMEDTTSADIAPPAPLSMMQQQQQQQHQFHKRSLEEQHQQEQHYASNKRQKVEDDDDAARRFRPYQAEQWSEKFDELITFKNERGHCCVPHTFKENPALARWVKRQRYQYKLKNECKASTMTDERVIALGRTGFIWDSHGAAWLERLSELKEYCQANGHCNVPSNHPSNPQLATWVKCQRRQYKLFWDGKQSNMTLERIAELEQLSFGWELRGSKKSSTTNKNNNKNSSNSGQFCF